MAIKLDQLIPKKVEIEMEINGEKRSLRIGPFTARHEIWLKETYGNKLEKVFNDLDGPNLARIAFHVMDPEDRVYFGKKTFNTMDEDGNEITESIGGYQLLAQSIKGPAEKLRLLEAITESLGISRALIEELEEVEKKKAQEVVQTIQDSQ